MEIGGLGQRAKHGEDRAGLEPTPTMINRILVGISNHSIVLNEFFVIGRDLWTSITGHTI